MVRKHRALLLRRYSIVLGLLFLITQLFSCYMIHSKKQYHATCAHENDIHITLRLLFQVFLEQFFSCSLSANVMRRRVGLLNKTIKNSPMITAQNFTFGTVRPGPVYKLISGKVDFTYRILCSNHMLNFTYLV